MTDLGIDAAVLCGGLGTRLRPAVADRQKVVADVGGRPFLLGVLEGLAQAGIGRFVLCVGHLAETVEAAVEAGRPAGVEIVYAREDRPLGTAGALRNAAGLIRSSPFLAANGDTLCPVDLAAMVGFHRARGAAATLALAPASADDAGGYVRLGADGRVESFREKVYEPGSLLNAGRVLLERDVLEAIPAGRAMSLEEEVIPGLLAAGRTVLGFPAAGPVRDIGTPERLARVRAEAVYND